MVELFGDPLYKRRWGTTYHMSALPNHYETLGLAETATTDEIRSAYRKLARQHHPDVNQGDATAEDKFKAINEANETLSDPEKRERYDAARKGGGQPFGAGGPGMWGYAQQVRQNSTIQIGITLKPEETLRDLKRSINYQRTVYCQSCRGEGGSSTPITCSDCQGSGQMGRHVTNGAMSFYQSFGPCPRCRGRGRVPTIICGACNGFGFTTENSTREIDLPLGCLGRPIGLQGLGNYEYPEIPPGDLIIHIQIETTSDLQVHSNGALSRKVSVDPVRAVLGGEIKVKTIDGTEVTCKLPLGTRPGQEFVFDGYGLPLSSTQRAPYVVQVEFDMPSQLTEQQTIALNSYFEAAGDCAATVPA